MSPLLVEICYVVDVALVDGMDYLIAAPQTFENGPGSPRIPERKGVGKCPSYSRFRLKIRVTCWIHPPQDCSALTGHCSHHSTSRMLTVVQLCLRCDLRIGLEGLRAFSFSLALVPVLLSSAPTVPSFNIGVRWVAVLTPP